MPRYELDLAHRPDRTGVVVTNPHVPFYLALEGASDAWALALGEACGDVLTPPDLGVVHVTSDFGHEIFVGAATFDVTLAKIGSSAITFVVDITQRGTRAATVTFVLAQVDEPRLHSVPLSPTQREALGTLL